MNSTVQYPSLKQKPRLSMASVVSYSSSIWLAHTNRSHSRRKVIVLYLASFENKERWTENRKYRAYIKQGEGQASKIPGSDKDKTIRKSNGLPIIRLGQTACFARYSMRLPLSLLPAHRQSRKLLASGGLCSCFRVRPDVCLK